MRRLMVSLLICLTATGMVGVSPVHATVSDALRKALKERFRLSRLAVESEAVEGRVLNPGTILILQADSVPAKKLRVVQRLQLSVLEKGFRPRWIRAHVPEYAPVIIAADGRLTADPGDFTLAKGTRLVVLDLQAKADRLHLFTHTLDPVRLADGKAVYGCTEFIFPFEAGTLERGDPEVVQRRIEQWLALASAR